MNITSKTYFRMSGSHQSGEMARLITNLREHNVDMEGLWGFTTGEGGAEFLLVPKDETRLTEMASKLSLSLQKSSCFRLSGEDKLGALQETLDKITNAGINLRAVNALSAGSEVGCYIWCEDEDVSKLTEVIGV